MYICVTRSRLINAHDWCIWTKGIKHLFTDPFKNYLQSKHLYTVLFYGLRRQSPVAKWVCFKSGANNHRPLKHHWFSVSIILSFSLKIVRVQTCYLMTCQDNCRGTSITKRNQLYISPLKCTMIRYVYAITLRATIRYFIRWFHTDYYPATTSSVPTQIAMFMGSTWGPPGSWWP